MHVHATALLFEPVDFFNSLFKQFHKKNFISHSYSNRVDDARKINLHSNYFHGTWLID